MKEYIKRLRTCEYSGSFLFINVIILMGLTSNQNIPTLKDVLIASGICSVILWTIYLLINIKKR